MKCRRHQLPSLRLIVLGLAIFSASSSALSSQALPSTPLPSSPAISSLQQAKKQLQDLETQMIGYQSTWQALMPAWQNLLKIETHDNGLLTQLTQQLGSSTQDSQVVSQLSTKLSAQFNQLSISYSTDRLLLKIGGPVLIALTLALAGSIVTKGFTQF